ncbi:MAG: alpha/beta fold hydrolase, partial [Chloroflexi bacterium]|nr:alpha/beta fold hydrolase [Chloroflexota bacterium]
MSLLRFLGNLILAIVVIALSILILGSAYGATMVRVQEQKGLDEGATGGGWLWLEGQPIYYRTWGPSEGRAIVLVHGYQVEGSETWVPLAENLARAGLRVVAVDLKGFGRSSREAPYEGLQGQVEVLGAALNQMGLYENTLVAHGQGAAVVAQLAAEQPQFVRQVVLIAPEAPLFLPRWKEILLKTPYLGRALIWAKEDGGPLWKAQHRRAFA